MFDEIAAAADDAQALFLQAGQNLVRSGQYHQLFDLRLMQRRHELGLPLENITALDDLEETLREGLEKGYLDACREVGQLLLEQGRAREAWTYLRPAGEKMALREWLARAVADQEHADELIELALYEAIDAERGFAWLLAQRGTCNAITELEGLSGSLPIEDQKACSAVLVRHMHDELLNNLRGHLKRLELESPASSSIVELLTEHPALLADGAYHIDTSHLSTTVRFARLLTDPALLRQAIELAEYGRKLAPDLQYPDRPPFEEIYPAHLLLFQATLGDDVESAVTYFCEQAQTQEIEQHGTGAIETYLILLVRVSRPEVALEEFARLVPVDGAVSPHAPTLLQLARASGNWDRYLTICQERDDVVGFASGQLEKRGQQDR